MQPNLNPASAVASAALSKPCEPEELVFYDRVTGHPVVERCPEMVGLPVYSVVQVLWINHKMKKKSVWLAAGATHLVMLSRKGKLLRGIKLLEIAKLTIDQDTNRCLLTPTSVSGDPMWLWEWEVSGTAATWFIGALSQVQRTVVSEGKEMNLEFEHVRKEGLMLKPAKVTLSVTNRIQQIQATKPELIASLEEAAFDYVETVRLMQLNEMVTQEKEQNSLAMELNQRRTERTVVAVVLCGVMAAFESFFKCGVASILQDMVELNREEQKIIFETQRIHTAVAAVSGHSQSSIRAMSHVSFKENQHLGIKPMKAFTNTATQIMDPREGGWADPEAMIDLRADFKEFSKLHPTKRHVVPPDASSPSAGLRPGPKRYYGLRSSGIIHLTHPSWVADRSTTTKAADIYAMFREHSATVESHRWVSETLLEIQLSKHTPYPTAMAAAIQEGYVCQDPHKNHLLLDV
eukprot:TRINITY_DN4808_c0_g1_i1.p1 TRINITY_DN4808_c0_g1~~TRINITY_DN4808_c0_g1_i1.p1  ORF type:complete len:462 (+),score=59.09 TRINITY_DN4808_c0_g1_i1:369-1754(+)